MALKVTAKKLGIAGGEVTLTVTARLPNETSAPGEMVFSGTQILADEYNTHTFPLNIRGAGIEFDFVLARATKRKTHQARGIRWRLACV